MLSGLGSGIHLHNRAGLVPCMPRLSPRSAMSDHTGDTGKVNRKRSILYLRAPRRSLRPGHRNHPGIAGATLVADESEPIFVSAVIVGVLLSRRLASPRRLARPTAASGLRDAKNRMYGHVDAEIEIFRGA